MSQDAHVKRLEPRQRHRGGLIAVVRQPGGVRPGDRVGLVRAAAEATA
jgi:hypothetical protein